MNPNTLAPETVNGSPLRLDPLDNYIYAGLQQQFLSLFNTKTIWTTSTDKIKAIEKLFADNEKKVTYPYAFLMLDSWTKSEDRGNRRASSIRGTRVSITNDSKASQNVRFLPVDFSIEVEWFTNSFKEVTQFGRLWMFVQERGSLNFQVAYGQSTFDIKVIPDSSITFPKREADPDNVQEYMVTTRLLMQGYISEENAFEQPVVDTLEINTMLKGENAVVWSYKTPPLA